MAQEQALCVKSNPANLAQIAEFVSACAERIGLDADQVFAVQLAVDEACSNSMEHAYAGQDTGEVTICCYAEEGDMVIKITDSGIPFDAAQVPAPDLSKPLEERSIGGLGLYLMRKLMDSVTFTARDDGNEVVMRKHLSSAQGAGATD